MTTYFDAALKPNLGRHYIGDEKQPDFGPPAVGDTVTVRASDTVDFYVLVEDIVGDRLVGELVYIEPGSRDDYNGWSRGQKISVDEAKVAAIIRKD